MATTVRLGATLALLFLAHGAVSAQLPVAPHPHISLDEFAKEYRWWQLPAPSPEAQLVRLKWYPDRKNPYLLAFRHTPATPAAPACYLVGDYWRVGDYQDNGTQVEVTPLTKPTRADLERLDDLGTDWFALAAQFRLRNWDELAVAAYAKALARVSEYQLRAGETPPTIPTQLYARAWEHWRDKIMERDTDRKDIFMRLDYLSKTQPWVLALGGETLFADLKLTVAARKSKPGSIESLIDELTEHWDDPDDWENEIGQAAYWKLIEHGLDAVPALTEHLNDARLTRTKIRGWKSGGESAMRVGYLVEYILNGLSGGRFETEHYGATAAEWNPPKDHRWLEMARCGGEEAWLLGNVLPKDKEEEPFPNRFILRVIRAKYPHRLKDVYQTLLRAYPHVYSERITKAIVASKLPPKDKIAFLEQGGTHENYDHRQKALEALAEVDATVFRKYLLQTLESLTPELRLIRNDSNSELWVISLIRKTDDRKCWTVLTDLSRRVSPTTRLYLIRGTSWSSEPNETDTGGRECIRYLLSFLNDTAIGDESWDACPVVRDYATVRLAFLLGLVTREEQQSVRSPREISLLRDRVRELAERELARPAK